MDVLYQLSYVGASMRRAIILHKMVNKNSPVGSFCYWPEVPPPVPPPTSAAGVVTLMFVPPPLPPMLPRNPKYKASPTIRRITTAISVVVALELSLSTTTIIFLLSYNSDVDGRNFRFLQSLRYCALDRQALSEAVSVQPH